MVFITNYREIVKEIDQMDVISLINRELDELYNQLADADIEIIEDVEFDAYVLTISLINKKQYVINKHAPTKQIWFSSPKSGADYFSYDVGASNFINKQNISLRDKLQSELEYEL